MSGVVEVAREVEVVGVDEVVEVVGVAEGVGVVEVVKVSGVVGVVEVDGAGFGFEDQNVPTTRRNLPFTRPCRWAAGKNGS